MAICLKCLIGGSGSGGGLLPAESDRFRLEVNFEPISDGEIEGARNILFEGDVVAGDAEAGISAAGLLVGNYGTNPDEQVERDATVETYTRNGALAFVALTVRDERGRVTFSANLTPQNTDAPPEETVLDAQVFMSNTDEMSA